MFTNIFNNNNIKAKNKMASSLTLKKEKKNFFYWITNFLNKKKIKNKSYKKYDISEEELLEFEKWCSLQ
jgi:hypothetical protein